MKFPVVLASLVPQPALHSCLESLLAQRPIEAEILIVQQSGAVVDALREWEAHGATIWRPGKNVGTCRAWNWGLEVAFAKGYPVALLMNDDMLLTDTRTLTQLRDLYLCAPRQLRYLHDRGYSAICISKTVWDEVGPFDEGFWPCLVPETPVLTDGLRWVPIGDLHVGDGLIGVDEFPERKGASRSYRRASVQALRQHRAECIRITVEDGRQVVCTVNHRWLTKLRTSGKMWFWRSASRLRQGDQIAAPLRVWEEDITYDAGWLAGIFDGEGWISASPRKGGMGMSQLPGPVLDRTTALLEAAHIPFAIYSRNGNGVKIVEINRRQHALELLGRIRPIRLLQKNLWDGLRIRTKYEAGGLAIERIEQVGSTTVIDLQTSTRTFLANGFVSHNCYFEDNDHHWRCKLAGIPWDEILIESVHGNDGSSTLKHDPEFASINAHTFNLNRERYRLKWGAGPHEEIWTTAWNGGAPQPSVRDKLDAEMLKQIERPYALASV